VARLLVLCSTRESLWRPECLQDLAVGFPELEGAAGDTVLLYRFTNALPEVRQVHAYGISGIMTIWSRR
jgi:hypothetical protein